MVKLSLVFVRFKIFIYIVMPFSYLVVVDHGLIQQLPRNKKTDFFIAESERGPQHCFTLLFVLVEINKKVISQGFFKLKV